MRRIRIMGLCLAAVCAMSAVAAASASAAPGFVHMGMPLLYTGFTGKSVGGATIVDAGVPLEVKCSKEKLEGEIELGSTTNIEEVHMELKGCYEVRAEGSKKVKCPAKSPGRPNGTVRTKTLVGELGEVLPAEAASERGLDLKPAVGTVLVKVEAPGCGIPNSLLEGSIIGEVQPKGPPETKEKKLVSTEADAIQKIQKFTFGPKDTLGLLGGPVQLTSTVTLTFEELVEVT